MTTAREPSSREFISHPPDVSRGFLPLALEAGGVGLWRWSSSTDELFVSDHVETLFGLPRGYLGRRLENFLRRLHPEDSERVSRDFHAAARAGGRAPRIHLECRLLTPAKDVRVILLRGAAIQGDSGEGPGLAGLIEDATDRRVHRDLLMQSDEVLRHFVDNTSSLVCVKSVEGRYLLANREFHKIIGGLDCQVEGKTDQELFPAETAAVIRANEIRVAREGVTLQTEEILRGSDGDRVYLSIRFPLRDTSGEVYATGAILTDITAHKKAEHEFEEQRKKLQLVLDSVGAQIWHLDAEGRVLDLNWIAARETGLRRTEILGGTLVGVMPNWDFPERRHEESLEVIRTGEPLRGSIESYRVADEVRWVRVDKVPVRTDEGGISGLLVIVHDITELTLSERALRQSDDRYRAFIENSTEGIWRLDIDPPVRTDLELEEQVEQLKCRAVLTECNRSFIQIFGEPGLASLVGRSARDVFNDSDLDLMFRDFVESGYRLIDLETQVRDGDGRLVWLAVSLTGTVEDHRLLRAWGTHYDVTERRAHLALLEHQATHDALTNLPNRSYLYQLTEDAISLAAANERRVGLLLVDLDRFKEINDTVGHQHGDHLLQLIGPRLEAVLGSRTAHVARLGGDEFGILLPSIDSPEEAHEVARRVHRALKHPFDLEALRVETGGSIGIAVFPEHGSDASTLMRCADVAMYFSKRDSRGYRVYDPHLDPHTPFRLSLMTEVRKAIREHQLTIHYQPKISLRDPDEVGVEALVRWSHPDHGLIPPGQFIPLVEMTDQIQPLTLWVIDTALSQWRAWKNEGMDVRVSVNLSTRNLVDDEFPTHVERLIRKHEAPPSCLELELTESAVMADPEHSLAVLHRIHAMGVSLSLDDYGTGYSSLAYLRQLPIQALKIDLSFVINMTRETHDATIVYSTIHLAHNLGLQVVAEGVENRQTLDALERAGCDLVQGHYISVPLDVDSVTLWLRERANLTRATSERSSAPAP